MYNNIRKTKKAKKKMVLYKKTVLYKMKIIVMKVKLLKSLMQRYKDIKNIGRSIKLISGKSHGSNTSLHSLIIKLLNAGKMVLRKNYGL